MLALLLIFLLFASDAWATIRYADNQLGANCTDGTYSFTSRTCGSGSDGNAYTTFAAVITPTVAGDQICVRSGTTWTTQMDLSTPNKSGSAVGGYITVGGCSGEIPTIRFADPTTGLGYGAIRVRGNRGYFIFENMILDGSGSNDSSRSGWAIRDGNHHFILRNLEIKEFKNVSGIYIDASDVTIQNCKIHDQFSSLLVSGTFHYAIYYHDGNNVLLEGNEFYNNVGGGMQIYPGPVNGAVVRRNKIHDNNQRSSIVVGGLSILPSSVDGGPITNVDIYENEIYNNGSHADAGTAYGIRIERDISTNIRVYNNVFYGNKTGGLAFTGAGTGQEARNNIATANGGTEIIAGAATLSHNACTAAESCGSTNKVTITGASECLVDPTTEDFRLKQGTNPCVDAGTTVATRPSSVSANDVGAYERGTVSSAVVASTFIEVTVSVMTPGVLPASGITAFTVANGTSTGTPVVDSAVVKAGSNNIIQLTVSGFTASGSCTISYGAGNMTDSLYVGGPTNGAAQGVNSASGLAVSGTCDNSAGSAPPTGSLTIHYKLDEGAGTNAADEETVGGGDQPGTLSGSPTWTTSVVSGAGVAFTANADQRISVPYGNAVDPRAQSFTLCVWVKPNAGTTNKIVAGPIHGTNQRMYFGINASGFWGIGVGSSTYDSGNSEFQATNTFTRICLINNATSDIATLVVNKIMGTSAAAVKSSASITALASDFKIGCGFSNTLVCGDYTVDEMKIWTKALSQTEIDEDYDSYVVVGDANACYKQQNHRWQRVSLDRSLEAENIGAAGATIDIVENGAVALVIQVDCTGSAGSALALRAYYSTDGSTFSVPIPNTFGSDNISFWGDSTDSQLNRFTATCCLSGALAANHGVTILSSVVSPTITLAQNHSYTVRLIIRVGAISGESRYIRLYQDNGAALSGGYTTTPRLNVIPMRANSGP